jgi:cytochrome b561
MQIDNTKASYGVVTKMFHWTMAIIIIGMLILGVYMVTLSVSLQKLKLYGWHKEFGILVLMLACLRLGWRMRSQTPALPFGMPKWQVFAAHASHWALYGFMFAIPLTGWLLTSAANLPPSFFGLFVLPPLVAPNHDLLELFATIHQWLAYCLIGLLCLHVGAALQHHFVDKDEILRRML